MKERLILNSENFSITIERLCYQLIESHDDFSSSVLIGIQPRGVLLAERMHRILCRILKKKEIPFGKLDVTFFRDDFRKHPGPLIPQSTDIDFIVEDKKVVLVDDVLFTGRTIRAGLDAIMAFGRPTKVDLVVLVDRRYSRHLPIEPTLTGIAVDTISAEKVKVEWKETDGEDAIRLITPDKKDGR